MRTIAPRVSAAGYAMVVGFMGLLGSATLFQLNDIQMTARSLIARIVRQENVNFLLTNRIPRRWLTLMVGRLSRGIVGACGRVADGMVLQAKGFPYTVMDLLADPEAAAQYRNGSYATLRLTSGMYHRFHPPELPGSAAAPAVSRAQSHHVPGKTAQGRGDGLVRARLDDIAFVPAGVTLCAQWRTGNVIRVGEPLFHL